MDSSIALGRRTVSKVISEMVTLMERRLCSKWIKLSTSEQEKRAAKSSFYEQFGIPGVIGCIDGTHIKLLQPQDGSAFFNRKGNFSINAMIVSCHNDLILYGKSFRKMFLFISDLRS